MNIFELNELLCELSESEQMALLEDGEAMASLGITSDALEIMEELYNQLTQEG